MSASARTASLPSPAAMLDACAAAGRRAFDILEYLGALVYLVADGLWWTVVGPLRGKGRLRYGETLVQSERMSLRSFGIVSLVIFFVGMILAFQMAYVLKTFGVVEWVANMVGVAMFREMGPLLVGIVMTGFAGAAMAAEIGSMVAAEEVLALEASALDPVRFLVTPRLVAAMALMPLVTLIANYVGVLGGFSIGYFLLDMDPALYLRRTLESLKYRDVITGLVKAEAFGIIVTAIACLEGFRVSGGAEGVGRATTNAVVRSIVAIIACDLVFTAFFFFVL
jgi:phospholipid/cholesterol/gamma-HCH transport system permease protein